jgi:hypothetical protein
MARVKHLCFPCILQQAGSDASGVWVDVTANCAKGSRRQASSSIALQRPRSLFAMSSNRLSIGCSSRQVVSQSALLCRPWDCRGSSESSGIESSATQNWMGTLEPVKRSLHGLTERPKASCRRLTQAESGRSALLPGAAAGNAKFGLGLRDDCVVRLQFIETRRQGR